MKPYSFFYSETVLTFWISLVLKYKLWASNDLLFTVKVSQETLRQQRWYTLKVLLIMTPCIFFSVALQPNADHGLLIFVRFLDHTQRRSTVGRTPLDEWSARRRDLYLTTHNTHNRQTPIPPVGFEPTISVGERPQTYASDRATTGSGMWKNYSC